MEKIEDLLESIEKEYRKEKIKDLHKRLCNEFGDEFNFSISEDGETIAARMFFDIFAEDKSDGYNEKVPSLFITLNGISFEPWGWTKLYKLDSRSREIFFDYVCRFGLDAENA